MREAECDARPVKTYIMSDLLKKFDQDTTNDFVKIAVAVVGFYMGLFYRMYFYINYLICFIIFDWLMCK